ncbi:S8 family serine peptidase, partial [bacterium]|nr:S8 family serine peptidase [bacterium]
MCKKSAVFFIILLLLFSSLSAGIPKYIRGKMIISIDLAYNLNLEINEEGFVSTGLADIDELNREYKVTEYRTLLRNYRPANALWDAFHNTYVFIFEDKDLDMEEITQIYRQLPCVDYAKPDMLRPYLGTPNDPLYPDQWHLRRIKADSAWNLCKGSEEVIMGALDSGVDWKHEDLGPILWQNTYGGFGAWNHGEDLDGDGHTLEYTGGEWVFDPDDVDGIDTDFNGWVDDFIGYDFIRDAEMAYDVGGFTEDGTVPDNDPADFVLNGHGTHVSGTMIAATNNEYGIAGLNWKGKLMCLRTGYYFRDPDSGEERGLNNDEASYSAMEYAIEKECDVLNFSWGNAVIDTIMRGLVRRAWDYHEIIMMGGAGNDNVDDIFYPANYPHVISVAGTNRYDQKAMFSNYGTWIEISAPGRNITSTIPFNTFVNWDGTSMASPVAAGAAGLIIAAFPDSSSEWIINRLIETADSIDHINPGYEGLLGSGRINLVQAIGPIKYPWLEFESYSVSDLTYGDGNGRVDPGEEGDIVFTLSNQPGWQPATGVTLTITSSDIFIEITQPTATVPNISPGSSGSNASNPLRFLMEAEAPAHLTKMSVTVTTEAGSELTGDIEFMIGRPGILLYDADEGDLFEEYYFPPLQEGKLVYDWWDRNSRGVIESWELDLYETIIYFTGNCSTGTVTPGEQSLLMDFLELGEKSLLITGQYIGDEIGESEFFTDYLRGVHTDDALALGFGFNISGIEGEPLSEGLTISTLGGSSAGNQRSLSGVAPGPGASGIYRYGVDTDTTRYAAIKHHNTDFDYKAVYFGFGLEGIGTYMDSVKTVIFRVLEWFGHTPGIDEPGSSMPVSFNLSSYPNPFNASVTIAFNLTENCGLELDVYNLIGEKVCGLANGRMA